METPVIPTHTLNETIGAMMLGTLISSALWGVACAQAWHYYQHFPNDSTFLRWYVFVALTFDTVHQVLTIRALWYYAVTNWAFPLALLTNPWSYVVQLVPGEIASFLVQAFFIYRIYILSSKRWWLITPLIATTMTTAVLTLFYAFRNLQSKTFANVTQSSRRILGVSGGLAFINDLSIALILCYFLYSRRTGRATMTAVLNRLIVYALGTGLITSILALVAGICWLAFPDTFISAAIIYIGTKMHVNSLLISLNSRHMMLRQLVNGPVTSIGLSRSAFPPGGIRIDQSTTHRTDRTLDGPLTFKHTGTTYTMASTIRDDIEMNKSADPSQ